MIRLVLFCLVVLVCAFAGAWIVEHNGTLVLRWGDYVIETSIAVGLLFGIILLALATITLHFLSWFKSLPRRLNAQYRHQKQHDGLTAIAEGFTLLAAGETKRAQLLARKATKLLGTVPAAQLLEAQAAEISGDHSQARLHFVAMLENKTTRSIALRGLLHQAEEEGDHSKAIGLAERLLDINPKADWVLPLLVELYSKTGEWQKAQGILERAIRRKLVPKAKARRRIAMMLFLQGQQAFQQKDIATAFTYAAQAHKRLPGFVPATQLMAQIYRHRGKIRKAEKLILNSWKHQPHPVLAEVYRELYPKETPDKREKRFERLTHAAPEHAESHIQMAKMAMESGRTNKARTHLRTAISLHETARACRMMAQLESKDRREKEAKEWRERAEFAAADPSWTCTRCFHKTPDWQVICGQCGGYDTVEWMEGVTATVLAGEDGK